MSWSFSVAGNARHVREQVAAQTSTNLASMPEPEKSALGGQLAAVEAACALVDGSDVTLSVEGSGHGWRNVATDGSGKVLACGISMDMRVRSQVVYPTPQQILGAAAAT